MIRLFRHYFSFSSFFFTLGEGVLIYLSVFLATHFFFDIDLSSDSPLYPFIWLKILLITLITQLSLHFNDLYSQKVTNDYFDLFTRIIQSIGITSIALAIIYFIFPSTMIGRGIYFISLIFLLLFIVSWRLLYAFAVKKRYFGEKAIILGNGELANDIINELDAKKDIGYYVSSIICKNGGRETKKDHTTIPVHYGFDSICAIARKEDCNNVIVALDEKRGMLPTAELLKCKVKGVNIIDGEMFYERITGKLLVEKIHPSMLIFSDGFVKSKAARLVKRTIGFSWPVLDCFSCLHFWRL
jgi:FlaA1/EpsC-like NDP-sugar epimerase